MFGIFKKKPEPKPEPEVIYLDADLTHAIDASHLALNDQIDTLIKRNKALGKDNDLLYEENAILKKTVAELEYSLKVLKEAVEISKNIRR